MNILKLKLYKYKRFNLSNISYFEYTPEKNTQLILGTNGSGKSSLLEQLSPIPPDSKDFYDGGYKEISISHKGCQYILKNTYDGKPRHSFIKELEELNPSGTLTIQKSLIEKEFGLTDWLHEILIGKLSFCNMGVGDRRKWFSRLSANDYEYVIALFNRVKSDLRDVQGAIKIQRSQLAQSEALLVDPSKVEKTRLLCAQYQEEIDALHALRNQSTCSETELLNKLSSSEYESDMLVATYRDHLRTLNFNLHNQSPKKIGDTIEELKQKIYHTDRLLEEAIQTHQKSENEIYTLSQIKGNDILNTELLVANSEYKKLLSYRKYDFTFEDPQNAYKQFQSASSVLSGLLSELDNNEDKIYSKVNYQKTMEQLIEWQNEMKELQLRESKIEKIISQQIAAKQSEETECPKCNHRWIIGYNESTLNKAKDSVTVIHKDINALEKSINEKIEFKEKIIRYSQQYNSILQLLKNYNDLQIIWDIIVPHVSTVPSYANQLLISIDQELLLLVQIQKANSNIIEIQKLLQNNQENTDDQINQKKAALISLELEISKLSNDLKLYKEKIEIYIQHREGFNNVQETALKLKNLRDEHDGYSKDLLNHEINKALNQLAVPVMNNLVSTQKQLSSMDDQAKAVESLKSMINDLVDKEIALKALNDSLSPKSGLIAEALVGFINLILGEISKFVNSIWSYNLSIVPILLEGEDDELNYKFQVSVNNETIIDDVSLVSQGMREVINLGFKLVVMKYLHLDTYPLYLDEFGASFDKQHRINASRIINDLIHYNNFEKIFIISHYEESYGSLQNTDIIILHNGNIEIPTDTTFNQVVVFEES